MAGQDYGVSRHNFVKGSSALLGGLSAASAAGSSVAGAGRTRRAPVKVPDVALGRTAAGYRAWGSASPTSSGNGSPPTTSAPRCTAPWNWASITSTRRPSTATPRPALPRRRWARRSPRSATRCSSSPRPRSRPTRGPGSCCDRASSGCGPTESIWSTCTISATRNSGATASWSSATTAQMAALREARRQGVVRFIGASGHLHPTRFHEALDSGEIDVLMNAVNFVVRHTYDFEHKVWSRTDT